jgi:succinate-semialdehyde dehydrogenase / glutarate-semialdehyde dehydrogenase
MSAAQIPYPPLTLHIDGEWLNAGARRTHCVVNPATGVSLGDLPLADPSDLDRALVATDKAWRRWRRSTADERGAVLIGAARLLRERAETIARNATLEESKTLAETRIEVQATANLFEFYAGEARRLYGRVLVRPTGTRSLVVKVLKQSGPPALVGEIRAVELLDCMKVHGWHLVHQDVFITS